MLRHLARVFSSFRAHEVRYVVIGGIAAIMHGVPRSTFDLDILIDPTLDNARRLLRALKDARFGTADMITAEQLLQREITMFNDWVPVDVQTRTPGITFEDAWEHRETMTYQGESFYVVSLEHLLASKRAAGREKDVQDVEAIEGSRDVEPDA